MTHITATLGHRADHSHARHSHVHGPVHRHNGGLLHSLSRGFATLGATVDFMRYGARRVARSAGTGALVGAVAGTVMPVMGTVSGALVGAATGAVVGMARETTRGSHYYRHRSRRHGNYRHRRHMRRRHLRRRRMQAMANMHRPYHAARIAIAPSTLLTPSALIAPTIGSAMLQPGYGSVLATGIPAYVL